MDSRQSQVGASGWCLSCAFWICLHVAGVCLGRRNFGSFCLAHSFPRPTLQFSSCPPRAGDLAGISPSSSDVPACASLVWVAVGRSGLLANACQDDNFLTMSAPGRHGNNPHDQSCRYDQELGGGKKQPRRSGASADEDTHGHRTRSNVAFLRVSCGLHAQFDRLFPAIVCLFRDIDGWCYVSLAGFSCVRRLASISPSSSDAPVFRASLVWGAIGRSGPPVQVCVEDRAMTIYVGERGGNSHRCPGDRASGHTENWPSRQSHARQPFSPRDSRQHSLEEQQRSPEVLLRVLRGPGAQLALVSLACVGVCANCRQEDRRGTCHRRVCLLERVHGPARGGGSVNPLHLFLVGPSLIQSNSRGITQSNSCGCTSADFPLNFAHIRLSFFLAQYEDA